jgi:hypothetical protein
LKGKVREVGALEEVVFRVEGALEEVVFRVEGALEEAPLPGAEDREKKARRDRAVPLPLWRWRGSIGWRRE